MLQREKDAAVDYMEFGLVEMIKKIEPHVHDDAVAELYKDVYALLQDFDETTQVSVDSIHLTRNKAK
jgi:hypothetical protein